MEIWTNIASQKALAFGEESHCGFPSQSYLIYLPRCCLTCAGSLKITPGVPVIFADAWPWTCLPMEFLLRFGLIWVTDQHRVSQQEDNCFNEEGRALQRSKADIKYYPPLAFSKKEAVLLYFRKSSSKRDAIILVAIRCSALLWLLRNN